MPLVHFLSGEQKRYLCADDEKTLIQEISKDIQMDIRRIELLVPENNPEVDYYVLIQEPRDYPFARWADYYDAFTQSLCGEVDKMKYPRYAKMESNYGFAVDCKIMLRLIADHPSEVQEGFYGLIQTCVDGSRYSYEIIPTIRFKKVMDEFLAKGAVIDAEVVGKIMRPTYHQRAHFEEDMGSIRSKGFLLHVLMSYENTSLLLEEYTEWVNAVPYYYEDMMHPDTGDLLISYSYMEAYCNALLYEYYAASDEINQRKLYYESHPETMCLSDLEDEIEDVADAEEEEDAADAADAEEEDA